MHQPCNVAKAKSSSSAASRSPTSKISQLRRKRFFVLVRILLKRLERDDPEGYERAKEVSIICVCVRLLNRARLSFYLSFLNYWSSHTHFLTALLHTCHTGYSRMYEKESRGSPRLPVAGRFHPSLAQDEHIGLSFTQERAISRPFHETEVLGRS